MSARERWPSRWGFVFAAIGSAIGLGNVWRFPYLAYKYGGGAFLVPWLISLLAVGIPWFIAEIGMGQLMQRGAPGTMGRIGKKWEWTGWLSILIAFVIVSYYTVIMAWSLIYLVSSATLAWGQGAAAADGAGPFFQQTLGLTSGPEVWGGYQWPIVIALVFSWAAIYWFIYKGPERLGKLVKWTVILPWCLLVVLFIRGITLPGAVEGLNFYLTPNFSALLDSEVWFAAISQIAFTLSLGVGIMCAYGSYNPPEEDVNNNAIITSLANCGTSFFAGFAVFSTLGFLTLQLNQPIEKVAGASVGLAFKTFPIAISMMPFAGQIIGIIFFLCLWLLGIDSAFSLAEAVSTPISDKWGVSTKKAAFMVTVAGFLLGLFVFSPGSGLYWLDIVDRAAGYYGLILCGLLQVLIIGWAYGATKLRQEVNALSEIKIGRWFDWMIKVIVPLALVYVVVGGLFRDFPSYGGYPVWATVAALWGTLVLVIVAALLLGFSGRGRQNG